MCQWQGACLTIIKWTLSDPTHRFSAALSGLVRDPATQMVVQAAISTCFSHEWYRCPNLSSAAEPLSSLGSDRISARQHPRPRCSSRQSASFSRVPGVMCSLPWSCLQSLSIVDSNSLEPALALLSSKYFHSSISPASRQIILDNLRAGHQHTIQQVASR